MCLFPLSIRNPTKSIHTAGGQLLDMQVPCGHCADCLKAKRNEWYVRTYYECQRTFSRGGYVYFDTLTYSNKYLPKLSHFIDIDKYDLRDFSCFNHSHFKLFLKRLRRRLSYHLRIDKDAFRYFLTTEYGEDDRFTHRPHHHILFFVYADVDPLVFSQLVSDCWQYGRTDGFPFKPATYVHNHVYGRDYGKGDNMNFIAVSSVCMYVSKYMTKSSKFVKTLNARMATLREKLMHYDIQGKPVLSDDSKELLACLRRNIDMFHRQSHGFGLSYLNTTSQDVLMFMHNDQLLMKDKDKIKSVYPLPMYYKRKLYYTLEKHVDGSRYWQLTELGKRHFIEQKLKQVDNHTLRYMDIIRNCSNDDLVNKFFLYLGDRDISDYTMYVDFYRGRHRGTGAFNLKTNVQKPLTDEEANLHDWCMRVSDSSTPYVDSRNNLSCDEVLRKPIFTQEEFECQELDMLKHGHHLHNCGNSQSMLKADYIKLYTFNENSDPSFRDFDKMTTLLQLMTCEQREKADKTFHYIEDLKSKFKTVFNHITIINNINEHEKKNQTN